MSKARPLLAILAAAATIGVAGCTDAPPPVAAVEVTRGGCGTGWSGVHGGDQTIQIHNVGTVTMEVELVDPASHAVYAEIESMGPGTTRPMRLVLATGSYALTCFPAGSDAETGPTVTITDGPARGAVAVPATSENDLAPAVKSYREHVTAGLATLATEVGRLQGALRGTDRVRARAAWLDAELAYGRLGAAYDTFGDFADAIDGQPAGAPDDPDFAGLRRIEWGLWHGQSLATLRPVARQLGREVAGLRAAFARERTDPNDLPLRAHEILENSLQFELTGDADQGSGDGLAIIAANLDGTRAVLAAIAPVVQPKYAGWGAMIAELEKMTALVRAQHSAKGWVAPGALKPADRRRLAGTLGELLERLAPVAAIGEVRRTS